MKQLDVNSLVAYVDGELDSESAALVEGVLERDAEARETAQILRESAALVRAAHNQVQHEAVPDRLLDIFDSVTVTDDTGTELVPSRLVNMILDAPEESATSVAVPPRSGAGNLQGIPLSRRRSVAAVATAALFAAVMVGGGMMFQKHILTPSQGTISHQASAVAAMNDPWREAAFQEALETKKSETAVIWANPENGRSGAIMPVKTYRRDDGTFCRAFRVVDTGTAPDQPNYGVACREPGRDGRWVKTVEAISAPAGGMQPRF